MKDNERLEFIKSKINYMKRKRIRGKDSNQLIDDFLWLIDKVEKGIKESRK
jgi:hypothetical protein